MLTRLKVSGFKNLVDVDVRFGPFTCIAGVNGVGKSNLFDAIKFLSSLADRPLIEAALSIRDEEGRTSDIRSLFHRVGDHYHRKMAFEAEMIVPLEGLDDFGQPARASITFLRYTLELAYRADESIRSAGSLEILKEELMHINIGDAGKHLLFPYKDSTWRRSAVSGRRTSPFISTEITGSNRIIKIHQDGGTSGRALSRSATHLPRTVLSSANAAETPTALLARKEMQSWRLLQLEPSALRKPDDVTAPTELGTSGAHLAAALYHLAHTQRHHKMNGPSDEEHTFQVYGHVASRLAELIDDVHEVWVDRDERRELLTLYVAGRDKTPHPARSLSDGTLRFLALAVLEADPEVQGVICLEEPENGIHPKRIPAMLRLLQGIATDVNDALGPENPLRQIIINTHSPAVVTQIPDDSLLMAELKETVEAGQVYDRVCFSCLSDTWRIKDEHTHIVSKGELLAYLNPIASQDTGMNADEDEKGDFMITLPKRRRVADREDLQLLLFPRES
jgi:predicted ATPase